MAAKDNTKKTGPKNKAVKEVNVVEKNPVEVVAEIIEEKASEAVEKVNEVAEEITKSQDILATELDKLDITKKEDNETAKTLIEKEIKKVEAIKTKMSNGNISAAWNGSAYLY